MRVEKSDQLALRHWFQENQRPLPWREDPSPYRVWISEVMLQQTTSAAVISYFLRFVGELPDLRSLAEAPETKVLELWSGLGYYSRARNLHKAAKELNALSNFPQHHEELIQLPGFGPYTSRSVSSLAFGNPVGVLDGNVIRVLSRKMGKPYVWWKSEDRQILQDLADEWVQGLSSREMNQAMMELGATICLPAQPKCLLCPLMRTCEGQKKGLTSELPLRKEKPPKEILVWKPCVIQKRKRLFLIRNNYAPFLKGHWIFPGSLRRVKQAPKQFHFRHTITRYNIFTSVSNSENSTQSTGNLTDKPSVWVREEEVSQYAPASLMTKVLKHL